MFSYIVSLRAGQYGCRHDAARRVLSRIVRHTRVIFDQLGTVSGFVRSEQFQDTEQLANLLGIRK
jgi:hypothetical protein